MIDRIKVAKGFKRNGIEVKIFKSNVFEEWEKVTIAQEMMPIINQVFVGVDLQETMDHIFGQNIPFEIYLLISGDKFIGFSACSLRIIDGKKILFREGAIINPVFQGKGIYSSLLELSNKDGIDFMAGRTRNPRVYEAIIASSCFSTVIPQPQVEIEESFKEIGQKLAKEVYGKSIETDTFIMRNSHSHPLYSELPKCRNKEYSQFIEENLGELDAFFVLAKVK